MTFVIRRTVAQFCVVSICFLSACIREYPQNMNYAGEDLPENTPIDLTPYSPAVVYADGWRDAVIMANFAKTTVDVGAHFATSRNACGKDAFGAIDLATWNQFSKSLNSALKMPARTEDQYYCVSPPMDTSKWLDGTLEVNLPPPQKSRILYELRDGQICSSIQDKAVSDVLLEVVQKIIVAADREDCPNGWGS